MPGPCSKPVPGKTQQDKQSGKWARRFTNLHRDPIRENGGKQFKTTKSK